MGGSRAIVSLFAVMLISLSGLPVPVVAEASNDGWVVITPVSSNTTEAGGTASFEVSLARQPNTDVTIPVNSSNPQEGSLAIHSLIFTPANWNIKQPVLVNGVDDAILDGHQAYWISLGPSESGDFRFHDKKPDAIKLANWDNESQTSVGLNISSASVTSSEAGASGVVRVSLMRAPSANVTIPVSSSDTGEGIVSINHLQFTVNNWHQAQVITVTGVDDSENDGAVEYRLVLGAASSDDNDYNGLGPSYVAVTNYDNDNSPEFFLYDNMNSKGKPVDLTRYGLKRLEILYPSIHHGRDPDEVEIQSWVEAAFGKTDHGLLSMDYEQWRVNNRPVGNESQAEANEKVRLSIAKYSKALTIAKQLQPHFKYGFYGTLPLRDYWSPVSKKIDELKRWHQANDALQALADEVDVLYPSLYTFYNDPAAWIIYATANIQEARRLARGKPVYAYVWPYYHNSNQLSGQAIDGEFWRLQLETLRNLEVNGVVLWAGNGSHWNDNDAWWQTTIDFLIAENGGSSDFNQRPQVDAGDDLQITDLNTELSVTVTDDGWPGTELGYRWFQVAGSGRVVFSQPTAAQTGVTFSQPGNYRLYVEADDGDLKGGQYLSIAVVSRQAIAQFSYDTEQNSTLVKDLSGSVSGIGKDITYVNRDDGQAISFNGSSSFVELVSDSSQFNFGSGDFSLATWVYVNSSDDGDSSFISKGLVGACCESAGYPGYFLGLKDNVFTFRLENDAPGNDVREVAVKSGAFSPVPRNRWVHVAAIKKYKRIELYVDGSLVAKKHYPHIPYSVNTDYPLVFGAQKYWGTTAYLDGRLDDTALFNRVLSLEEVETLAGRNNGLWSTVLDWFSRVLVWFESINLKIDHFLLFLFE